VFLKLVRGSTVVLGVSQAVYAKFNHRCNVSHVHLHALLGMGNG
jgi:hypothetical protein